MITPLEMQLRCIEYTIDLMSKNDTINNERFNKLLDVHYNLWIRKYRAEIHCN